MSPTCLAEALAKAEGTLTLFTEIPACAGMTTFTFLLLHGQAQRPVPIANPPIFLEDIPFIFLILYGHNILRPYYFFIRVNSCNSWLIISSYIFPVFYLLFFPMCSCLLYQNLFLLSILFLHHYEYDQLLYHKDHRELF